MKRTGRLSDQQTLRLYERGATLCELAGLEGLSAYGVIGRLHRARKARRAAGQPVRPRRARVRRPEPAIDWHALTAELRRSVEQLEQAAR